MIAYVVVYKVPFGGTLKTTKLPLPGGLPLLERVA